MMKKLMILTAAFAVLGAIPAMAGDGSGDKKGWSHKKGVEHLFEKNDTNGDNVISKEEHMAKAEERFSSMDADGDGNVTKEEAKAKMQEMHKKWKEKRAEQAEEKAVEEDAASE